VTSETDPVTSEARATAPRGSPRAKAALVLAAVFALGAFAGGAVGRVTALRELGRAMEGPPAEARAHFRLEALRRHLDLDDAQLAKIRTVIAWGDAERDTLMATCGPGLDDLRKRTDARVRDVLTEDQRKRFDELEQRRRRHGGGPRPGRPQK